ncbi:hypothetical protein OOT46_29830 [Aquabacterium sp. A7-Y]|uniref:hypothetical protein n=1 Tax=Aquabacterium sp. A7-Y TaxID=1349605 RepID=UPI00223DFDF9|nr:hypothetical protein [Aquabacterium sp. A7-Y]MCW7542001.1 hypothetical protein [Aquabacterium sp. A7-Y]
MGVLQVSLDNVASTYEGPARDIERANLSNTPYRLSDAGMSAVDAPVQFGLPVLV